MRILVSNDDGVFSPGIRALAKVAAEFGQVRVVAPDVEQSAMSHAITVRRPLHYTKTTIEDGIDAYRVDGTPADCVAVGTQHRAEGDLGLTGIRPGYTLGHIIWDAGAVAAARQGAFLGIRASAFSARYSDGPPDYERVAPYVRQVVEKVNGADGPLL